MLGIGEKKRRNERDGEEGGKEKKGQRRRDRGRKGKDETNYLWILTGDSIMLPSNSSYLMISYSPDASGKGQFWEIISLPSKVS